MIYYLTQNVEDFKPISDTYEVKKKNWFIKKFLKWALKRKIIEEYREKQIHYKSVEINFNTIRDLIYEQVLYLKSIGIEPTIIIIGRRDMERLNLELTKPFYVPFTIENQNMLFGLKLIINPIIDGTVVA